ncbi:reverse transcriptase domain-containing protein [Tanacetum coccineum]
MFSIIYEPIHGIIYKNSKKEKRVLRHSEIHTFCDAMLNRVLEGLRSYNNDVKYGYIQRDLTNEEVEYLKLFEEEIEVSKSDENMGDVCEWKTIEVGDKVMLEVSSSKDVVHFGKKEMLAPRYVGPLKYLADINLHVHLEEIKVDKTLCFVEEPVEIIDREVKSLKHSRIPIVKSIRTQSESCYTAIYTLVWAIEVVSSGFPIVKVRQDSKHGPKFTWECEDHMKANTLVPPPSDSAAGRPALRVLILGGIIYTRENIGNVRKRISEKKTKNEAKNDKTEHGMEKRGKVKVKSTPKVKVKVKVGTKEILNGPTRTHLMGRSFHEAWDRYKDLLRACPHHGFTELHQLDTFYNALKPADQDSLNSAAGGNLLERSTQDVLTIIENKSKVRNSRNKSIVSQVKSSDGNSSSSDIAKLTHACLAADGNTFPEYRDNIQGYVAAAAGNYNQGNSGYRPPGVANQTRPPGFVQPNGQNNQNCFSQPQGYNRGNNFNQNANYQAPIQQNQSVPLRELEKIKKINDVNIKAMQAEINNVKNELRNEMQTSIQASMSNQTNELKNMMASFFQMNTASTSGTGSLPSNTITNPKGELKAITTRSGLVLGGPTALMPPSFINPEDDKRVEETLMDPEHGEFTIKAPPPHVQKAKPSSQRNFMILQRDPRHPHILYPSRMHQEKRQEKDEVQIHKFWQMFKQLHINISLADALILIPKYQKMLKSLLSNKEKLLELANTPLNENCSAVILKKLPEKLGDPGKFLIPCGFSELKCKALADLGASINLMPLSVWKKLGLPELISTRMTLELANRAICTPAGIARDVFVPVGKFTFPADFVIVDYESDPRVPLILGRPFLRTARALIDVHGEEMILRDGDERLILNMRHDTSSYSNKPKKESINMIDIYNVSHEDYLEDFTTSSSPDHLLEEFVDELALITFPPGNDDLPFDIESDLREIEYLLNHDPTKEMDSILEDSVDEGNLADPNNDLVDTIPEMFTDEHTLDFSSPPKYDDANDDLFYLKTDNDECGKILYDDPFDSKEDKIKESKLLIDKLDPPRSSDFLPSPECDSVLYEDFFRG